jgi:hypothetical protein
MTTHEIEKYLEVVNDEVDLMGVQASQAEDQRRPDELVGSSDRFR